MEPTIHILDTHSANQIAAGEVVERPASVVKELVENAIDAGAKHIDVTVEGNGVTLIRVRDDGRGISAADLPRAVVRHATSKIKRIEDLDDLQTLGFRGEALASIASVSQLEIASRPAEEAVGLCLKLSGGEEGQLTEVGCPTGTSVTVRNLFYNTPARLKFLKSTSTEFGQISDIIGRLALAHPEVAFSLSHPKQVVFQTSGRGDLREAVGAVLGHAIARRLIPFQARQGDWRLEGYISPLDLVRSSKQNQVFMLNGRNIRSPFLNLSLEDGYHTLIPAKLHPVVVVHLSVSPAEYDVNVHPTKMDVRFKNEQSLAPFISQAVRQTLLGSKPVASFQSPGSEREPAAGLYVPKLPDTARTVVSVAEQARFFRPESMRESREEAQRQAYTAEESFNTKDFLDTRDLPDLNDPLDIRIAPTGRGAAATGLPTERASAASLPPEGDSDREDILARVWPLTQIFHTYILATDGQVLLIIDQHAAHERINYERLFAEFKGRERAGQNLLIPLPLEFTLQEEQVVLENLWALTEMGFVLEQFGERTYLLRSVPVHTGKVSADLLLRQFIEEVLQKNTKPTLEQLTEEWIYLLACKESIKGREVLSLLEMEQLIARLRQTANPYTCPHGRPTMLKMTRSEIEKRFYRT